MKERMKQLLLDASKCFAEVSSPFTTEWLAANNVTSSECIDLSEAIASAIKLYVALPSDERLTFEIKRAVNESELPETAKRLMNDEIDFRNSLRRVQKGLSVTKQTEPTEKRVGGK